MPFATTKASSSFFVHDFKNQIHQALQKQRNVSLIFPFLMVNYCPNIHSMIRQKENDRMEG